MPNPYVNKVEINGTTVIDLTGDTVTSQSLLSGFTAHDASGRIITGELDPGGQVGYVWQDENGYVHLSDEQGSNVIVEPLSVTQNGTYTASTGHAYSPVTVNVSGGSPTPPAPTPWVRPSDFPDLSLMDVSAGDIIYMTSYADEARGFCHFYVDCTGNYTVELGSIVGSAFVADSTYTYATGEHCQLYYGSANGTYKVLRVTGASITSFRFQSNNETITIGDFKGYGNNQGIVDVVGKLPSCTVVYFANTYNLINVEIDGVILRNSMSSMFNNCYSLTSLDVSGWNTSAVTNMNSMFGNCSSLTALDVSGWDTSKVTSMSSMFYYCYSLTSLDVSGWDTSAVANMGSMFYYCKSLTALDVSGWDTSAVTNMNSMFNNCSSLTALDVSGWDTSAVTNMGSMFQGCSSLTALDVSGWDTSAVANMGSMFSSCYSLIALDVSGWDTSAVTNMSSMFYYCNSLTSLDVSEWDTGAVTNMSSMFNNCCPLTSLDVSGWDTSAVTNMNGMFQGCYSLTSLDVSGWDTSAVTNMSSMFQGCYSLTSLDVSGWDFSLVTNTGSMFRYCRGLYKSITIPSTITKIGTYCFVDTRSIYEYHFLSTTPPTLESTNAFNNMTDFDGKKIYVPRGSLSAYQSANNWSTYASYMQEEVG